MNTASLVAITSTKTSSVRTLGWRLRSLGAIGLSLALCIPVAGQDTGGPGSLGGSAPVGEKVENGGGVAPKPEAAAPAAKGLATKEQAPNPVEKALAATMSADFQDTPLRDVIQFLKETTGVPIYIASAKLEETGLSDDVPVSISAENLPMITVLEMILEPLDLAVVDYENRILITSADAASSTLDSRIYDVSAIQRAAGEVVGDSITSDELIELITKLVEPTNWSAVGGPGEITRLGEKIVILQDHHSHRQIEKLLRKMARSLDIDPNLVRITR